MTEKRFTMGYKVYRDNLTGERYDEVTESYKICHLLNELFDENEQLKKENKELRQYLGWQEMELEELEDINKNVIE